MNIDRISAQLTTVFVVFIAIGLSGCGGTKVLKEPAPLAATTSLVTASDQRLDATLEWVIVRDGPGTWAKNADWDEYQISVRSVGGDSLQITNVAIQDSLGTWVTAGQSRKQLVKGAKQTVRRYKSEGLKVKAGFGTGTLLAAGAASAAGAAALVSASGGILATSGGAAAGATGGILLVPAFAIAGIVRGVNNGKVNKQIKSRQTVMPLDLQGKSETILNVFVPLAPSPRQVEITYLDSAGTHTLRIDTRAALDGLHLADAEDS
jgi:hypothetical protein